MSKHELKQQIENAVERHHVTYAAQIKVEQIWTQVREIAEAELARIAENKNEQ